MHTSLSPGTPDSHIWASDYFINSIWLILPIQNDAKNVFIETLANRYSSESTQREISNEYQDDRV